MLFRQNMRYYSLSVIGFSNYTLTDHGDIYNNFRDLWMKPHISRCGYAMQVLIADDKQRKTFSTHRLVSYIFIPIPDNLKHIRCDQLQVNHKDGVKLNNLYSNLEWCTNLMNAHHAMESGLWNHTHLTEETCHDACRLLVSNEYKGKIGEVSKILNIPYTTIQSVWYGRNWKHISSQYGLPIEYVYRGEHAL